MPNRAILYSPANRDLYLGAVEVTAIDQKCVGRGWWLVVAEWIFRKWVEWRLNVGVLIGRWVWKYCNVRASAGTTSGNRFKFREAGKDIIQWQLLPANLILHLPYLFIFACAFVDLGNRFFISFSTIHAFSLLSKCLAGEFWRPRDFCELNVPPHHNWDIHSQSSSSFANMPTRLLKYQKWQNQSLRALWSSGQNKLGIMLSKMRKLLRSRQIKSV